MVIGLSKTSNKNIDKENIIGDFSEKVKMSLNVDSEITSSLLIQRLTELYEDPIVASVRETVSNALDSIVKAKSDRLVKITSPTKLSPYFVVEDNGVGMSYEDLTLLMEFITDLKHFAYAKCLRSVMNSIVLC